MPVTPLVATSFTGWPSATVTWLSASFFVSPSRTAWFSASVPPKLSSSDTFDPGMTAISSSGLIPAITFVTSGCGRATGTRLAASPWGARAVYQNRPSGRFGATRWPDGGSYFHRTSRLSRSYSQWWLSSTRSGPSQWAGPLSGTPLGSGVTSSIRPAFRSNTPTAGTRADCPQKISRSPLGSGKIFG